MASCSIKTVETVATARAFLESHYNSIFNQLPVIIQRRGARGVTPNGFEFVRVLGKGSFGVVRLVKTKTPQTPLEGSLPVLSNSPPQAYAMKVIHKSTMIRSSQQCHLLAERDLLVAAEGSEWIIPLIAAFQDPQHLYLVMDFCIGGDFLGLLIRKNTLPEHETKFYMAEMILCLEEVHRMGWIHRDVKPDNFLISASGHLKISDFGLAFDGEWSHDQKQYHETRQMLMDQLGLSLDGDDQDQQEKSVAESRSCAERGYGFSDRNINHTRPPAIGVPRKGEPIIDWRNRCQRRRLARSVVGTSQYMAPEVVRGEMYDGRCD
ncbi:hypothetical protein LTR84_008234 [Exophiala bonariae]|uniref:non-specific serine/threonine protein kinase n=1 Tax=Exophiala bonariae TaxID=1690606 RepID=A0AAV9N0V0_9EURO|nr:hypothetical protein LTR84_008234 [Exophiala bonariae]